MGVPGYTARRSLTRVPRHADGPPRLRAVGVLPQELHRSPPLKLELLSPHHAHTCSGVTACAQMIWSGACQDAGLTTVCTDSGCWC